LTKSLQALGFTLDEIVDALHGLEEREATCANQRWRLEKVLERIDGILAHLQSVRTNVVTVLESSHAGRCSFYGRARRKRHMTV
jgi:DNA-binding transcriptional MerR regulator